MKKVLILGSSGQLGSMIYKYFSTLNKYEMYDVCRTPVNPNTKWINIETYRPELRKYIAEIEPDIIINAVGVLVKESEIDPERALWLNTCLPNWLEYLTKYTTALHRTKVVQLSTNCIFHGAKGPYKDTDEPDGIGKALGELVNDKDLTIRTSTIGPAIKKDSTGLFEWFMAQGAKGCSTEVPGYSEVYWNGISSLCLAQNLDKMLDADISGLYQLAPNYSISKYRLLKLLAVLWNRTEITVVPYHTEKEEKTLINSYRDNFTPVFPKSYSEMFTEMKSFMELYYAKTL
jgi:dTDP-4-dehydrorhamnose reductase